MRECGLKSPYYTGLIFTVTVTPRAGVWIEIRETLKEVLWLKVTPRAGVWIEMAETRVGTSQLGVTPRAGVWIEIRYYVARNVF